ncbi:MAG: hypothetical protein HQ450_13820, partial [Alcaligenaceae bacterium]|nr:hypothetical protein [Alcaligenaceae bacterium]
VEVEVEAAIEVEPEPAPPHAAEAELEIPQEDTTPIAKQQVDIVPTARHPTTHDGVIVRSPFRVDEVHTAALPTDSILTESESNILEPIAESTLDNHSPAVIPAKFKPLVFLKSRSESDAPKE